MNRLVLFLVTVPLATGAAFAPPQSKSATTAMYSGTRYPTSLSSSPNGREIEKLGEKIGGFTTKQRLREEVESPFRKVRLAFFSFSGISALVAFYFSALAALKANIGGYSDVPPLNEALESCAINAIGFLVCGALAFRELQVGQANLERIAKGGLLARLVVEPADPSSEGATRKTLKDYRRASRVVIAAGGPEYINKLSMSLCSDQLADENTLPMALAGVDIVIIPVLLNDDYQVADSKTAWKNAQPGPNDRNFDPKRADEIIAYPLGFNMWNEYLESEIKTAQGQGFDILSKGITITVKKNGRILRRATGLPPYADYIGVMEVADGSRFGMPGDSERYGGP